MKLKTIFILACGLLLSCSSNDDSLEDCELELWGMKQVNDYYEVEYGPDEDNTTTVEVNQETFEYYKAIFMDESQEDCWEGMK